jgi:hypothetical protein
MLGKQVDVSRRVEQHCLSCQVSVQLVLTGRMLLLVDTAMKRACVLAGFYVLYHTSFTHSRIGHAPHGSSDPHVAAEESPTDHSTTQQQRQLQAQGPPGVVSGASSSAGSSSMARGSNVHRDWAASPDRPPRDPLHIMSVGSDEGDQGRLGRNPDANHHATRRLLKQDASSSEAGSGGPHAEHAPGGLREKGPQAKAVTRQLTSLHLPHSSLPPLCSCK